MTKTYAHSPDRCPSNHWNDGSDICADCGADLHDDGAGTKKVFVIESTYRLPIYRRREYEAESLEEACQMAIADEDWEGAKEDYETSGGTYITDAHDEDGKQLAIPPGYDEENATLIRDLWSLLTSPASPNDHDRQKRFMEVQERVRRIGIAV